MSPALTDGFFNTSATWEAHEYARKDSNRRIIYLRTSLLAHLVKNLLAMQETPVRFLGWEDLLEKG